MMKNLNKFLHGAKDIEFRQLELRLQLARVLRDAEINHNQSMAQMAKRLELTPLDYLRWRRGAIDFSVTNIAQINTVVCDLIKEKAQETDILKIKLDMEDKKK